MRHALTCLLLCLLGHVTLACHELDPLATPPDMRVDDPQTMDAGTPPDLHAAHDLLGHDATPRIQDMASEPDDLARDTGTARDMSDEDTAPSSLRRTFLYVSGGDYGGGEGFVTRFRVDPVTHALDDAQPLITEGGLLSYIAIDDRRHILYTNDETRTDLYSLVLNPEDGLGDGSGVIRTDARCHGVHLMLDEPGEHVMMSCYQEGETSLLGVSTTNASLTWQDTVDSGQKSHQTMRSPDGRYMFVVSLEEQHIVRYTIEGDRLQAPLTFRVPDQVGPRHMAFHPTRPRAYILGERAPVVLTATYTAEGTLEAFERTALDENQASFESTGAAIRVHPSGKWLLSTQRFSGERDGRIVVTPLDAEGRPTLPIQHVSSRGRSPRDLSISPDGALVVVSNRRSGYITTFTFDERSGALTFAQQLETTDSPHAAHFLEINAKP